MEKKTDLKIVKEFYLLEKALQEDETALNEKEIKLNDLRKKQLKELEVEIKRRGITEIEREFYRKLPWDHGKLQANSHDKTEIKELYNSEIRTIYENLKLISDNAVASNKSFFNISEMLTDEIIKTNKEIDKLGEEIKRVYVYLSIAMGILTVIVFKTLF